MQTEYTERIAKNERIYVDYAYMSNTGNLTPMDKSTFRWFRWIHRTNVYSVGEVFFRWKINDVMTHGKQISVKLRLSDGSDGSDGQASLL